jgi:hypothetical protein
MEQDHRVRPFSHHGGQEWNFSPFNLQEDSTSSSYQSSHPEKKGPHLLADTIIESAEDAAIRSNTDATRLHSTHSLEVEVAEEMQLTILGGRPPRKPLSTDPVAAWRRELWDRMEPECLTYLQSRPVRPAKTAVARIVKAAVIEQDWLRTVQESGRRVQSSIKAFKR